MRYIRPGVLVFAMALLASLCVHLPIYSVLGVLADAMLDEKAGALSRLVQFELVDALEEGPPGEDAVARKEDRAAEPESESEVEPEPEETPPRRKPPTRKLELKEPKPVLVELVEKPADTAIAPLPEHENKLAVKQHSDDPSVEPPENARFIAKENRRVEEETVAVIRNMHRDDRETSPGNQPGADTGEVGDAERFEAADLEDREGSDVRTATAREALSSPSGVSRASAGKPEAPAERAAESRPDSRAAFKEMSRALRGSAPRAGGEEQELVLNDGVGTLRFSRPRPGRGPGEEGGEHESGEREAARGSRTGSKERSGTADLRMSWTQFEETFGAEELKQQREAYVKQRRSKARGSSERRWRNFRAAIENFVADVKPGNQTALNAAASPFAEFISDAHRRIHREFAYRFIASLPLMSGPFSDPSLHTELEIVFNRDGSLHKVGVVRTSGFLPFDYGAFEAVLRAQPYPEPPPQILSGDGRVYVHWGFYRNARMCGTFNVTPYILPNPPGTPPPDQGPLRDELPERTGDDG
jgi:outer membrane biosynthesis protein TonB